MAIIYVCPVPCQDVYMLRGLIMLVAVTVENAVVSLFTTESQLNTETSRRIDHNFMIVVGCLYILFHIFFLFFIIYHVSEIYSIKFTTLPPPKEIKTKTNNSNKWKCKWIMIPLSKLA